jgi:hypothetical protein
VATVGLVVEKQRCDVTRDRDLLGGLRHRKGGIDHCALAGRQNCVAPPFLHAGYGHGEAILAGLQRWKHVESRGVGCGLKLIFRLDVFERHRGVRDQAPLESVMVP